MIHIRSKENIKVHEWNQLAFSYDGTGKAKGVKIYKNGRAFDFITKIDNLSKSIKPVTASGL